MTIKTRQLVFLLYLDRSGSTYLANLMNDFEDIAVSLEATLPDGIRKRPAVIKKPADISKVCEKLYQDHKFSSWRINRTELQEILSREEPPVAFDRLLPVLLSIYFKDKKSSSTIHIFKGSYTLRHAPKLKQMFPEAKIIFLARDPRAMYNSQKRSTKPISRKPMSRNPFTSALLWKKQIRAAKDLEKESWLYTLKYEDLIENKDAVLKELLNFLKSGDRRSERNTYSEEIPPYQRSLHTNITKAPLRNRINAWRDELDLTEVVVIEKLAAKEMISFGYLPEKLKTATGHTGKYIGCLIAHYIRSALGKAKILIFVCLSHLARPIVRRKRNIDRNGKQRSGMSL